MIRTKIAQILSPTRVVLAAGAEQGVQEGMEFIIYELSDQVYDPDTKESLGQLELHKGRVKVILVQEKLSTATTLTREVYRRRPSILDMVPGQGRWVEEYERLSVDLSASTAVKADLIVKVGDLVRSTN